MENKHGIDRLDKQIDENLRRVYSEAVSEPLPDRFSELLQRLREEEAKPSGAEDSGEGEK